MTRRLDPLELARAKRLLRCPDCDSIVHVDFATGRGSVEHDDTCPTFALRRRTGALFSLLVVPGKEN